MGEEKGGCKGERKVGLWGRERWVYGGEKDGWGVEMVGVWGRRKVLVRCFKINIILCKSRFYEC